MSDLECPLIIKKNNCQFIVSKNMLKALAKLAKFPFNLSKVISRIYCTRWTQAYPVMNQKSRDSSYKKTDNHILIKKVKKKLATNNRLKTETQETTQKMSLLYLFLKTQHWPNITP